MRRALTILTLCAAAATSLAACGGDDADTSGGDSGGASAGTAKKTAQDAALEYARCMREHGIDMPDPQVSEDGGMVQMRAGKKGGGPKTEGPDPKFEAAQEACGHLMRGAVREISPEQRKEVEDKMVAMARCMREQGLDFPDPQPGEGMRITPDIVEQPGFREAQQTCHEKVGLQMPGQGQP